MKFLLALTVLATTTAFAAPTFPQINCYEPAQQGGRGELAYTLEIRGRGEKVLHVVFPEDLKGVLKTDEYGCLSHPGRDPEIAGPKDSLKLCEGTGQRIGRLVPVDATIGEDDSDVYCDRAILDWFGTDDFSFMK